MKTGIYISGLGHGLVILWVLFGGLFQSRPPAEMAVAEVSILSEEEYAALTQPASAPRAEDAAPEAPSLPVETAQPDLPQPAPEDTPPAPPAPADPEPPAPETPPAPLPQPPAPVAAPEVEEVAPTPPAPPSEVDGSAILPESQRPRPAPRVAPDPAPAPEPEVKIDEAVAEATEPAERPEEAAPPVEESTAPEEAASEIVTEAEEAEAKEGLTASLRPRARPARPAPPAPAPATPARPAEPAPPASDPVADAIAAAVAEANQGAAETTGSGTAASGPPLTRGERDAFRVSVQRCWIVDAGSAAGRITVTVGFSMAEDGKVRAETIRLLSNSSGDAGAVNSAFAAARRAILRCQGPGYDLPVEKYAQWRDIEIVFDPSKMRN